MGGQEAITDLATFARVVQDDLLPLLEEYCYEDYAKLEKILGPGLVDARNQRIRHELFATSQQTDLIQALLAPSPEIITSSQAAAIEAQSSEEQLEEESSDDESESQGARVSLSTCRSGKQLHRLRIRSSLVLNCRGTMPHRGWYRRCSTQSDSKSWNFARACRWKHHHLWVE